MVRQYLLTATFVAALAVPAFAATKTYYVSQDTRTHRCYVVAKVGTHGMQIGPSYTSKKDAQAGLKAAVECKPKK